MAYKYTSYTYDPVSGVYAPVSKPESDSAQLYDNYVDAPVKNAHGSSQYVPVNISELDFGTYNVSGYYKLDRNSEIQSIGNTYLTIVITKDNTSNNKVAMYESFDNGVAYHNTVIFDNDSNVIEHKTTQHNTIYWQIISQQ